MGKIEKRTKKNIFKKKLNKTNAPVIWCLFVKPC